MENPLSDRIRKAGWQLRMWLIRHLAGQSTVGVNLVAPVIFHRLPDPASASVGIYLVNVGCQTVMVLEEETAKAVAERLLASVNQTPRTEGPGSG